MKFSFVTVVCGGNGITVLIRLLTVVWLY